MVRLVLRAQLERLVLLDQLALQVHKVRRVILVLRDRLGLQAHKDQQVRLVRLVQLVRLVLLVLMERLC